MSRALSFVTAIITTLHVVVAYPDGAPTSACSNFLPNHGVTLPQSSPSPYEVDVSQFAVASSFVYIPGQQYNSESIILLLGLYNYMHDLFT